MKLSLRFLVPLIIVLAALTLAAMPVIDQLTLRWFMKDLDLRASLIASTVEEPVQRLESDPGALRAYFARLILDERLFAVGYCAEGAVRPEGTSTLPASVQCTPATGKADASGHVVRDAHGPLLISNKPIRDVRGSRASIVVVQDMSFAERRSEETRQYLFYFFVAGGILISLITVVIAQLSWRGWVQGMRSLLRGEGLLRPTGRTSVRRAAADRRDLRALIRDLESEHRMRDDEQLAWTPKTLRGILERELRGSDVIVVSNREPLHPRARRRRRHRDPAAGERPGRPRSSRSCAPARARGSPTAAARPTATSSTRTIASPLPPRSPATSCAASGSRRRRSRATTTASPTRGCGRSATSRTCVRRSAAATGSSTSTSTAGSPTRSIDEARTERSRSCWCRTITSRSCRG